MLPIELKVATLGAARDEKVHRYALVHLHGHRQRAVPHSVTCLPQDVNGLRAETLLLQQLLLRIRITANLRRLRRERMHRQHARCALDEAIRDLPLLMDVESSERIQASLYAQPVSHRHARARTHTHTHTNTHTLYRTWT